MNPELGRAFTTADDQPGAPHVVILSHRLWINQFQGDRSVLGQSLRLNNESYTIVGVMPASAAEVAGGDVLWTPLGLSSTDLLDFKARNLQLVARLAPGVTVEQATAAIDASEHLLATQNPMWGNGFGAQAHLVAGDLIGNLRSRLFILLGAVSFVFLIACVNVANLLLTRGNARVREMAIRTALGAERSRLLGQLLTESAVLCGAAGAIGIALAFGLVRGLVAAAPPGVPRIETVAIDGPVLLFSALVSTACAVIVGLLPAIKASDSALHAALRDGGHGVGDTRSNERRRSILLAAEVALAVALLSGAGLMLRTAWAIGHVDPGFTSDHVLTAQLLLPPSRYAELTSGVQAYRAIRDEIARTPGVRDAAVTSSAPLTPTIRVGVGAEGHPLTDGERFIANMRMVSANYFSTMKVRLRAGRDFARTDDANGRNVAIINETLARRFWPGQPAVGKRIEGMDPSHQHFMEIVGVVADSRDVGLEQTPVAELYIPIEQMPRPLWAGLQGSLTVVVRTESAPARMERPIRAAIAAVDPSLPIASISSMDDLERSSRATARFNTTLLSVLGAIAVVLAIVGVYGVIAHSVSQRTREIGLRMALGAAPGTIGALVMRRALTPIGVGAGAGAVLSVLTTRLLREQLYGVAPGDPATITTIALLLLAVSLAATCIPMRRAMKIPPVSALAG